MTDWGTIAKGLVRELRTDAKGMAYTAIGVDLTFAAGVRWEPTVDITMPREHLTLEATYMADDG